MTGKEKEMIKHRFLLKEAVSKNLYRSEYIMKRVFALFYCFLIVMVILSACSRSDLTSLPEDEIDLFLPEADLPVFPVVLEDGPVFYVDAERGNDINPGTEEEPWATIQHAADLAKPGDTIIVKPGNYGRLVITKGGTPGKYITFRGENIPDQSHIDKETLFDPANPVHQKGNPEKNAVVAGIRITPVWNSTEPVGYIQIKNFEITQIDKAQRSGIQLEYTEDIQIMNNFIHDINPTQHNANGINGTSGADKKNRRILVKNNTLFRVMGIAISAMGEEWLIEGNEISHGIDIRTDIPPGDEGFWQAGDTDAIRFFGYGHVIRNNYIHDYILEENYGNPHMDAFQTFSNYPETQNASRILIYNNYVENMGGQIFMCRDKSETDGGRDAINNIIIRDNILIGSGATGVMFGEYSNFFTVKNNIIARSGYMGISISRNSNYARVLNNIFYMNYENDPEHRRGQMLTDESCFEGSVWDYNLHYPDFGYPPKPDQDSPFAKHDLFGVDPLFVDPANPLGSDGIPFTADDGYRLRPDSPARGAGPDGGDLGIRWDLIKN